MAGRQPDRGPPELIECENLTLLLPGIDRVEIHHDPRNAASAGIPRKPGFTPMPQDGSGHSVWRLARPDVS